MKARNAGMRRLASGRCAALAVMGLASTAALMFAKSPASAAEHSLAGIRIFASAHDVLNKYGDPTQITTYSSTQAANGQQGQGAPPPGMMGGPGQIGAVPPMQFGGQPGGGPGMPPGAPARNGANGGATGAITAGEALWEYTRPNNVTIDFLISPDGRVIQITVLGYKGSVVTERGVTLGTNFGKVVARYGYPEGQNGNTASLTMNYLSRDHVSFTLHDNRVIGITVAAIE